MFITKKFIITKSKGERKTWAKVTKSKGMDLWFLKETKWDLGLSILHLMTLMKMEKDSSTTWTYCEVLKLQSFCKIIYQYIQKVREGCCNINEMWIQEVTHKSKHLSQTVRSTFWLLSTDKNVCMQLYFIENSPNSSSEHGNSVPIESSEASKASLLVLFYFGNVNSRVHLRCWFL